MQPTVRYITWGPVWGWCGHLHRTLSGAQRCLRRAQARGRESGRKSDREIRVIPDGWSLDSNNTEYGGGPGYPLENRKNEEND